MRAAGAPALCCGRVDQPGGRVMVKSFVWLGGYLGRPIELVERDAEANPDAGDKGRRSEFSGARDFSFGQDWFQLSSRALTRFLVARDSQGFALDSSSCAEARYAPCLSASDVNASA